MSTQKTIVPSDVVKSYYRVRQALGYLGIALPFLLIVTGLTSNAHLEPSVSDFFHTLNRDIFVGTMTAISIFLLVYDGYDRSEGEWISDNYITTIAGIAGLGVAFFPNESPSGQLTTVTQQLIGIGISPLIHYASCLTFFYCMGHICMFKFSKTNNVARRKWYRTCGWIILASGILVGGVSYLKLAGSPDVKQVVLDYNLVFWIEAVGVWAFSSAWLVKGHADEAFLRKMGKVAV
ncbi:MAG: hypothetical protein ACSHW1_18770 [Yoonia sp.]|uniref:hypothetical protein n=1 Tax=Yoonia sp. TaxID=2212373 RepID=UPI003EF89766